MHSAGRSRAWGRSLYNLREMMFSSYPMLMWGNNLQKDLVFLKGCNKIREDISNNSGENPGLCQSIWLLIDIKEEA